MINLFTNRLIIRPLTLDDADFILKLFNTNDFIKNIGDKNIKSIKQAESYLLNGPLKMYKQHGIGLCLLEKKSNKQAVGINGLIRRPNFEDIDIGYALLPEFYNKGYAFESSETIIKFAKSKYKRLIAITNSNNKKSINLLTKLGLSFEKGIEQLTETVDLQLFSINFYDD